MSKDNRQANDNSCGGCMSTLINANLLGQKIKDLRLSQGLTQKEVSQDFISVRTLQKIESGEITPSFEVLLHIANKLKIDMFDLILSSRIPFYINYQLDSLLGLLTKNGLDVQSEVLKEIQDLLQLFNEVKLPYNDEIKINVIYAIFNAFFLEHRESTTEILRKHVFAIDQTNQHPSDIDLLAICGYLSLAPDDKETQDYIESILYQDQYALFPAICYAINRILLKKAKYQDVVSLSKRAIEAIDIDKSIALIPYIYGQWSVALQHIDSKESEKRAKEGLLLLQILRKQSEFTVLKRWLQERGIKVTINYQKMSS